MLTPEILASLNHLKANHLWRTRKRVDKREAQKVVIDNQLLVNFCSNDYLNLATHPAVIQAYIKGIETYGVGSGAAASVSGYYQSHSLLEERFAEFLQRDKALLFNSGYHANLGVITALANRSSTVIADKYCHASIIDGIQLSRAKHLRYRHHDLAHLQTYLSQPYSTRPIVITESIFSMQGDISNVKEMAQLCLDHSAMLIVDDAHGIGVLGKQGRGICEFYNLSQQEVPCLITPLGKAMGGMGAVVSGSEALIETLLQFARTYRYSTALPPATCEAMLAALTIVEKELWRREALQQLILFFNQTAKSLGLTLASWDLTPIKSVIIGSNSKTLALQKVLSEAGFFVSCIRPPTVPLHQSCIRISLNSLHTPTEVQTLLEALAQSICDATEDSA